jgi:hypothetical protein
MICPLVETMLTKARGEPQNWGEAMSSKDSDRLKQDEDKRALWERPAFRRLEANSAKAGASIGDDGNCVGTGGTPQHHSCPPG